LKNTNVLIKTFQPTVAHVVNCMICKGPTFYVTHAYSNMPTLKCYIILSLSNKFAQNEWAHNNTNVGFLLIVFSRIKRQFFSMSRIFTMKSVQNLKSFWRSSQNHFVFALFSSLYTVSYLFKCICRLRNIK
jgi:hypothetical protein